MGLSVTYLVYLATLSPVAPKGPAVESGFGLMEAAVLVVTILLVVAIVALGIFARHQHRGLVDLEKEAGEAEEAFALSMEEMARLRVTAGAAVEAGQPSPEKPVAEEGLAASAAVAGEEPSVGPEGVARRLQALQICTDFEGRLPLSLPPDGLIYGLRRGGLCAILPRQESSDVMHHYCRRFDLVFVELQDGDVLIYERLQNRIPELVEEKSRRPGG